MHHQLPRWAVIALALLAAAIGLAASAVTADFFVLGLQQTEADAAARQAMAVAGLLMIAAEVAAFFIAALLPRGHSLRPLLLTAGALLLAFECVTVFATQHALVQAGTAAQAGQLARIEHLRTSIAQAQANAASLSATAQEQVGSRFIGQRQDGAQTLRTAQELQQQADTQAQELAGLLASQRPTLADTFGQTGMLVYTVARAVLICVMGLVMCAAAGALLRAACCGVPVPVVPKATMPTVPVPPASAKWRSVTVPAISMAVAPMTWAVPAVTVPTVPAPGPRYAAARAAVLDGNLSVPSVRAIQTLVGGNTSAARTIQACLVAEGLIERCGQGYRLASGKQGVLI
ncbi:MULTISPECIES: hypothetical protein [Giesbergeria]|uniref:Uncharacterized protein n=1 Tax=Giesbergeria sinuosa TaxID=80883 RepID=A0ABV9QD64_9BURK